MQPVASSRTARARRRGAIHPQQYRTRAHPETRALTDGCLGRFFDDTRTPAEHACLRTLQGGRSMRSIALIGTLAVLATGCATSGAPLEPWLDSYSLRYRSASPPAFPREALSSAVASEKKPSRAAVSS